MMPLEVRLERAEISNITFGIAMHIIVKQRVCKLLSGKLTKVLRSVCGWLMIDEHLYAVMSHERGTIG